MTITYLFSNLNKLPGRNKFDFYDEIISQKIRKLRTSRSFIFVNGKQLENPEKKSLEPQED